MNLVNTSAISSLMYLFFADNPVSAVVSKKLGLPPRTRCNEFRVAFCTLALLLSQDYTSLLAAKVLSLIYLKIVGEKPEKKLFQAIQTEESGSDYLLRPFGFNPTPSQERLLVDDDCRKQMVEWMKAMVDHCEYSVATYLAAVQILDRYANMKRAIIDNREEFQLASITALYVRVKQGEDYMLTPNQLSKLSRGLFTSRDITEYESTMKQSMGRATNTFTVYDFLLALEESCSFSKTDGARFRNDCKRTLEAKLSEVSSPKWLVTQQSTMAMDIAIENLPSAVPDKCEQQKILKVWSDALENRVCTSPKG